MFTVKVVRVVGTMHSTALYEARSASIVDTGDVKYVTAHLMNDDDMRLPLKDSSAPDSELVDIVFIENANGKTTDVVRA